MCLAIPLRLKRVDGEDAVAEADGVSRNIKVNFIKDPKAGDYVIVHAGFAIERLKEDEALKSLEAWRELENTLSRA